MRLITRGALLFCYVCSVALIATTTTASVILSGSTYSENFNGTIADATSVTAAFSATLGVQAAIPSGSIGSSGWDGAKIAGTATAGMNFTVDNGAAISGALYSYGSTASGTVPFDPERALGGLASGSNTGAFGVEIVNNTGATVNAVSINYIGEYWRSSTSATGTPNVLTFAYEVGASGSTSYLTSATALASAALDLPGPTPVAVNGPLNGNDPLNQLPRAGLLSGLNLLHGQSLYIRWQDFNDQGNDAGLAIDNLELRVVIPEPASLALVVMAGLALVATGRRIRS